MILSDLAGYLTSKSIAVTGETLFLGRLPPSPDVVMALRQSGGLPPTEYFEGAIERPRVQVLVRGVNYSTARLWAEQVYQSFLDLVNIELSGTWYLQCEPDSPPGFLERDDNNRPIFVMNVEVWRKF